MSPSFTAGRAQVAHCQFHQGHDFRLGSPFLAQADVLDELLARRVEHVDVDVRDRAKGPRSTRIGFLWRTSDGCKTSPVAENIAASLSSSWTSFKVEGT